MEDHEDVATGDPRARWRQMPQRVESSEWVEELPVEEGPVAVEGRDELRRALTLGGAL